MIDVFWLPGTGFNTGPDGISAAFGAALDPTRFNFVPLRYPAAYGTAMSYAESVAAGRRILLDAVEASTHDAIIGGYSQGAGIAGDVAAQIWRSWPTDPVVGCALIADPLRPRGAGISALPIASGYGIAGERPIDGVFANRTTPVWWVAAEGDPITSLPAGNPLRSIADLTEFMCLASPGDAHRWGADLVDRAVRGRWQRWWSPANVLSWGGALAYARGYLPRPIGDGRHTQAYLDEGLAVGLAKAINEAVRE
ncbi:PE-PPE domain-containing protein [Nocardia brasiliensis]|uniref:PE-PPE domain-containing protein n=1 Tax=Nocardia brasiliensis TaxID=37326 RepID=UPI00245421E3|nr:PE-PPE domain-containing protein [Nocardia brasiliensis]